MAVFELVIALLLVGAILAAWAHRLHAPYPALRSDARSEAGPAATLWMAPSIRPSGWPA